MDISKLNRLRQINIKTPCSEDWDGMQGDEAKRFCAGCGCFVHNLEQIEAEEAEKLLNSPNRVCTRLIEDDQHRILTKSGWIPRLLLAGAIAAASSGCGFETLGDAAAPLSDYQTSEVQGGVADAAKALPHAELGEPTMGTPLPQKMRPLLGDVATPPPVVKVVKSSKTSKTLKITLGEQAITPKQTKTPEGNRTMGIVSPNLGPTKAKPNPNKIAPKKTKKPAPGENHKPD